MTAYWCYVMMFPFVRPAVMDIDVIKKINFFDKKKVTYTVFISELFSIIHEYAISFLEVIMLLWLLSLLP